MRPSLARTLACWALAAFFAVAGVLHFIEMVSFARIVPPLLPYPELIVQVTGAMKLAFATGHIPPTNVLMKMQYVRG